mmetsp:Transcript_7696/g.10995  ORF Transcript_7696/g.10995 Transcript_7696/m.10995 type:complete len:219 (-) Transcript_7696:154-810(-)
MDHDKTTYQLTIPTEDDLGGLAIMKDLAFAEKRSCFGDGKDEQREILKSYRTYFARYPAKLQHCRIVKDFDGTVIGGCQLQLKGDPADLTMPQFMRIELLPNEGYIEWIACHPNHTGKGIGSLLLRWAESCALENEVSNLTLHVMKANKGAAKLYSRKGFEFKQDPRGGECDWLCTGCILFCCAGCRYWSVCYMVKKLDVQKCITSEEMDRVDLSSSA